MTEEKIKETEVQKNFKQAVKEQEVKEPIKLTPEQRAKLATDEINVVLKKYGCVAEVQNQTVVKALPEAPQEKPKIETK